MSLIGFDLIQTVLIKTDLLQSAEECLELKMVLGFVAFPKVWVYAVRMWRNSGELWKD